MRGRSGASIWCEKPVQKAIPYLIKPDGHYLRDSQTNKPMVWDPTDGKAKTFDDVSIKDYALLGSVQVDGTTCHPSFQLLKDHVKKNYPLEKVRRSPASRSRPSGGSPRSSSIMPRSAAPSP